jgi:hypothetical protein
VPGVSNTCQNRLNFLQFLHQPPRPMVPHTIK